MNYYCYFDGSCGPTNPGGKMGAGVMISNEDGDIVHEYSKAYHPHETNTNNVAEYLAFIEVLQWLKSNADSGDNVTVYGDSNLVVQQMNGKWKIKNGSYVEAAVMAQELLQEISHLFIVIEWIPREENTYADALSNKNVPKGWYDKKESLKTYCINFVSRLKGEPDIKEIRKAITKANNSFKKHTILNTVNN